MTDEERARLAAKLQEAIDTWRDEDAAKAKADARLAALEAVAKAAEVLLMIDEPETMGVHAVRALRDALRKLREVGGG